MSKEEKYCKECKHCKFIKGFFSICHGYSSPDKYWCRHPDVKDSFLKKNTVTGGEYYINSTECYDIRSCGGICGESAKLFQPIDKDKIIKETLIKKYRKKPATIEAVQFDGSSTHKLIIKHWIKTGEYKEQSIRTSDYMSMDINTLEVVMEASPGDYIIKGVKGEFYPCKPDIFELIYEEVE